MPFSEDDCLKNWTYYPSSERKNTEYGECVSTSHEVPGFNDDVIFKFQGGLVIAAKGSRINLELDIEGLR